MTPEALLLAEYHEALAALPPASEKGGHILRTAAELRRLHEVSNELLETLEMFFNSGGIMRFYLIFDVVGEVVDCRTSIREAKVACPYGGSVMMVGVPINSETVRRLLGNEGGYATETKTVYNYEDKFK